MDSRVESAGLAAVHEELDGRDPRPGYIITFATHPKLMKQ
jgi:hypothetical protein